MDLLKRRINFQGSYIVNTLTRFKTIQAVSYQHIKFVIDFVLALILTVLSAPLLIIIAILISFDSVGPIIYSQKRIGYMGKEFTIFKFRSMKVDAPCISTEEMQQLGYNPVTRIGYLLRKTSLDELPQLFNILKCEMSFVGPRPALPTQEDVNSLREKFGIHKLRPGITGLAQVKGRDDLDTETKVKYDAEYCRKMSLWFDVWIVIMTFLAIFSSRGNK